MDDEVAGVAGDGSRGEAWPQSGRRLGSLAADLSAQARRLEQSNTDLHAFAASVSHDLQNPLTALRGYLTLLDEGSDGTEGETWTAEQRALLLRRASAAADQMGDLIGTLLDFATVDTAPPTAPVDLREVVGEAVGALAASVADKSAELDLGLEEATVLGAAPLLRTLVLNLVGNALKHGRHDVAPRVRVRTGRAGTDPSTGGAELVVSDNGPGVPDDELGRVTAMFARGADTVTQGYGIGLSTCRRIMVGHGGELLLGRAPEGGLLVRCVFPGPVVDPD